MDRWKVSHTHNCNSKEDVTITEIISSETDAASGFADSSTRINLPECFPPFPSNFTAVQIQFSWYVRNQSFSICLCIWALNWLYSCSPQGCPNNSEYHAEIFSWKLLSAVPWKGLSAAHYLTCPITFLAAVMPCSLEKPSPRARSQEKIAKICYFSKNLLLRGTGDRRNIRAGWQENTRKKITVKF